MIDQHLLIRKALVDAATEAERDSLRTLDRLENLLRGQRGGGSELTRRVLSPRVARSSHARQAGDADLLHIEKVLARCAA